MNRVLTIGHSTRPLAGFLALLARERATLLLDVRTVPRSRHNPQFNRDTLPAVLSGAGIGYRHLPELGGLRHARKDSPNGGWHNASFRGYADYMQTPGFAAAIGEVVALAALERCVLMCAEAVPWRCHRSLIADALVVRGIEVDDIVGEHAATAHRLTPFARVDGTAITYPPVPAPPHPAAD
ncbi:MAG: DUF488 domain-containing protein [Proteobacteria bacterium]|jgi:uncharacterized protein (DUF488 family)|nr:DUF488 domain-containing protein [Pseudomonadota bacterium]